MPLIPIKFFDETEDETHYGQGELDTDTGELVGLEHDDPDVADSSPFLPDGFEIRVGVLDMGGKELEFAIEVNPKTGRSVVGKDQLAEIMNIARAWVTREAGRTSKSKR